MSPTRQILKGITASAGLARGVACLYSDKAEENIDLPPKKWTLRRSGGSINTSLKTTGGVQWMGRTVSISGLTGI